MTIIDRRESVAEGTAVKAPCRVATTVNITLSGLQTIDGVTLVDQDRVLVKNQTDGIENGIYAASSGNWLRTRDFDGAYDIVTGTRIYVTSGTANAQYEYVVSTTGTITVGTTSIAFLTTGAASAAASAAAAAISAANAAADALLIGNQVHNYDTFAAAKAATIPSPVQFVRTLAYSAGLPESGMQYRKMGSNPGYAEPAQFQSADGAYWLFEPNGPLHPECFGAKGAGVQSEDDAPIINKMFVALNAYGGGTICPRAGSTYILGSLSSNGLSALLPKDNVNIIGEGFSAKLKLKAGVNTALQFYHIIFNGDLVTGTNNVIYSNFTIDLDGANNTGGLTAALNIVIGTEKGDNIVVDRVKIINNPGSTGIKMGRGPAIPPLVTNLRITDCVFENSGDNVNSGCIDHSSIWCTAANAVIAYNVMTAGAKLFGTGIEIHGNGVLVTSNSITDYNGGLNMANEVDNHSYQLSAIGNTFKNVNYGITVFSVAPNDMSGTLIANNNIAVDPATASVGIDVSSQVNVGANGLDISIIGNTITSNGMVSSASSTYAGIVLGAMSYINCSNNTIYNTQGPGIWRTGTTKAGGTVIIDNNSIINPGLGTVSASAYKIGILIETTANTPNIITVCGNKIQGSFTYGIQGGLNAAGGSVANNTVVGAATAKILWTGTGVAVGESSASGAPNGNFAVAAGIVTRVS